MRGRESMPMFDIPEAGSVASGGCFLTSGSESKNSQNFQPEVPE